MIVIINGQKAYIDIQKVIGMQYEPKRDEYNPQRIIIFFEGYQMSMIFPCESKEEAFKIMELIEENKKEVTPVKEIDNFKEALEYALKIVKR